MRISLNRFYRNDTQNKPSKMKKTLVCAFAIYLVFILLSQVPFIAENYTDDNVIDHYEANLTFPTDGKQGHYYVERYNSGKPGKINVQYTTKSNSLEVDCNNIKVLKIYCREMYNDKSKEIFNQEPEIDSNYYKTYFIARDYFYVHVYTQQKIDQLEFIDTPIPYNVTVNGEEWWLSGVNYTYSNDGMIFTKVPIGHNYVDIYFQSSDKNSPIASISASKSVVSIGEIIRFDASNSSDIDGSIISYVWDFSDGTFKGGITTQHKFNNEGRYNVMLTVTDNDYLIGRSFKEIHVVKRVLAISNIVDKPVATISSNLNYTYHLSINTTWTKGVKDIEVHTILAPELDFISASPLAEFNNRTIIWKLGIAFENNELPLLNLRAIIKNNVANNTIIKNYVILNYKSIEGLEFPTEISNEVSTRVNFGSILAPRIKMTVGNIELLEDSPPYNLYLNPYEYDFTDSGSDLNWYMTEKNNSLYIISGEYSENDIITITTIPNKFGTSLVTLWLIDSEGYSTKQPLWINITPVDDPPIFAKAPDLIIHYNEPYTFNYLPYIYDIDTPKDKLKLYLTENVGTSFNDLSNPNNLGTTSGEHFTIDQFKVSYNFPKSYVDYQIFVSLVVYDGSGSNGITVRINVTEDYTPQLIKELPDIYLKEGETKIGVFDIDEYFVDPDKDSLFYSIGDTHVSVTINSDHTVDITAPPNWNGVDVVTFRARDPMGAIAEDTIEVTVTPINDPPIIDGVPNKFIVHYDADYSFDLSPYITDEDNDLEELTLILDDSHIRVDPVNNLRIIMNYPYSMIGMQIPIIIIVSDGIDTGSIESLVKVTEDWPPEINKELPDINFYEDNDLKNAFNLNEYFSDKDSNALFYTYGQKFIKISISPDGNVDFISEPDWYGVETVTFRATDSTEAFVESVIKVTVHPVNDAPIIKPITPLRFEINKLWRIDISEYISDVDNNKSSLIVNAESDKLDINIKGRELLIYSNIPIVENLTISVSDGDLKTSSYILIEIYKPASKSENNNDFQVSLLLILILSIIIILSVSGYTTYRRYFGNYNIDEIFCISNNGLLISHLSTNGSKHRADENIVSGMLTAIINFTQEAFTEKEKSSKAWGIKEIQMNEKNILIDRGNYIFLATVFSGHASKRLYNQSKRVLTTFESRYNNVLKTWNGKMEKFTGAKEILSSMIKK